MSLRYVMELASLGSLILVSFIFTFIFLTQTLTWRVSQEQVFAMNRPYPYRYTTHFRVWLKHFEEDGKSWSALPCISYS